MEGALVAGDQERQDARQRGLVAHQPPGGVAGRGDPAFLGAQPSEQPLGRRVGRELGDLQAAVGIVEDGGGLGRPRQRAGRQEVDLGDQCLQAAGHPLHPPPSLSGERAQAIVLARLGEGFALLGDGVADQE